MPNHRTSQRPLSPHLQIYRPQLTSVLSILHRIAGIILALGALLIAAWFCAVAGGEYSHDIARGFFAAWVGRGLLFGWTLCACYHLCNGIRHLLWDVGVGLELRAAYRSGAVAVAAAIGLCAAVWLL